MQINPKKTIWWLTELDSIQSYKITNIVSALWLAERSVCMTVCKHGSWQQDVSLFAWKHKFEKGFELKNSSSLLYLPIYSSSDTWKIFRNMQCQFYCLELTFWTRKTRFWKASFLQNKDWLRVQASCTRLHDWYEFLF